MKREALMQEVRELLKKANERELRIVLAYIRSFLSKK